MKRSLIAVAAMRSSTPQSFRSLAMKRNVLLAASMFFVGASIANAQGAPCTAPANVYTGSGIPTVNSMCGGAAGVNLYLGVSQRYTSPAPTTDGNGTWSALTGDSNGALVNAGFAKWNFNFATTNAGSSLFKLTISGVGLTPLFSFWTGNYGDSSNLGYLIAFGFNNNDVKTFTFRLDQYSSTDLNRAQSMAYIQEVVNTSTVPEPSTYALMAAGLAVLGVVTRRRQLARSVL